MPDTIRCPGCGQENPAGSATCGRCNDPLQREVADPGATAPDEPVIFLRRPVRRPRPQPVLGTPLILWASVALVIAVALLSTRFTGLQWRQAAPIAGATPAQLHAADSLRAVLQRDSTDVAATIAYGDILYDTANWREAARCYERALARDSSRVQALVDLGVCWYNLGEAARAEQLFQLALQREPRNPVALYNLGYVKERAGDDAAALRHYHQSLAAGAVGSTRQAVLQHMQRIYGRTGRTAPRPDTGRAAPAGTP